ncbi:hypothetical protein SH449x_002642 [Pirellulaceae bacterium SH449]|jgi:hypothetical protein
MNRFVAILLIPFFLVGHALAHSHGTAAHPSANHGRAHIHVASAPHHGHHSHESDDHHQGSDHESDEQKSAPVTPVEHDSDAIYVASADDAYTSTDRVSIELGSSVYVDAPLCILNESRPPAVHPCLLTASTSGLPLYLLHAALRL